MNKLHLYFHAYVAALLMLAAVRAKAAANDMPFGSCAIASQN